MTANSTAAVAVRSAGVLPYAFGHNNEIYFLLGKESYVPGWKESDKWGVFGGKMEPHDSSVEHCAAREFYEETAGCVCSFAEIRNRLHTGDYRLAIDLGFKKSRSVCYFVHIPYLDYPNMFRNAKHFVQYCNGKIDCIEKTQLSWFGFEQLRRELFDLPLARGHSNYGRKPFFRKKFVRMMLYFYKNRHVEMLSRAVVGSPAERNAERNYVQLRVDDDDDDVPGSGGVLR